MSPRYHPEYVGSEEDPTCVICQQYLYLSSVACSCRPSSLVCLEHWDNLCECRPSKHQLLYRHTLAELNDLMLTLDNQTFEEPTQSNACRKQFLFSDDSNALTKKVRSGRVTHAHLAEEWLLKSLKIIQDPFSNTAFVNALKEAEQFLWAGAEMDPVRDMANNLVDAKKWALDVRNCLYKVENCLHRRTSDLEKVPIGDLQKLLSFNHLPCNEPGHLKLKVYVEDASVLLMEMTSVISSCSHVSMDELEKLYDRAIELPVYFEECGTLLAMISSAKVWVDAVSQCVYAKSPTKIEIDSLYKLKLQMLELRVQLPEMALLLDLLMQVELWQTRCSEMLKGPINIKELDNLLKDAGCFSVNLPELKLLRQHHCDAVSWISRFHEVLVNVHEREDQESIAHELTCILKDGQMLRVQVDELSIVKEELKRASCRVKALKARSTKMPMDYIRQLISEANVLQIEKEKLFVDISGLLMAAISWEERARHVLGTVAKMSEFEDVLRDSEELFLILPSLCDVKDVLTSAKSWLKSSEQFLGGRSSSSLLNVDTLKEIIAQSKLLKVSLEEPEILENILKECQGWEHDASALLKCAESVFDMCDIDSSASKGLMWRIVPLLDRFKSCTKAGLSMGFDLPKIYEVQNAFSKLQWCLKALSLCSRTPLLEEVERLQEDAGCLSTGYSCHRLISLLIDGARWLKKALVLFPKNCVQKRCKVTDVEGILAEAQMIKVPYPVVVAQLANSIEKHKSWQEKVHLFFGSRPGKQSWSALLQLKELGNSIAFDSLELDAITSECRKVEKWIVCCKEVVELLVGNSKPLCGSLSMINLNLDKSLQVYQSSKGCSGKLPYICCASDTEDQDLLACSVCNDRYHLACLGSRLVNTKATSVYTCPYCLYMESGAVSRNGCITAIFKKKRPELKMLIELVSAAKDFCIRTEETEMLQQVVEQALQCKAFLTEIVDCVLSHDGDDLGFISRKLATCMKAVAVAGVTDQVTICGLELALTRYSWKVRTKKLLLGSQKPTIQQFQRLLKDGSAINIPFGDHFMKKLTEVKCIGFEWCDKAKKVACDCGELGLDEVFKLIAEGENLPVHFEKELKLLRARSVLYCICRKPYDNRAMIACDTCDEWYHFDCINLRGTPPKTYHCPACKPLTEESSFPSHMCHEERSTDFDDPGPQTPSPRSNSSKRRNPKSITTSTLHEKMVVVTDLSDVLRHSSGIDQLWWRTRKPLKRTCRKRVEFDGLSPFFHL